MLRILWKETVTYREVLERIDQDMSLEGKITKVRIIYFGHMIRSKYFEKDLMHEADSIKRCPDHGSIR